MYKKIREREKKNVSKMLACPATRQGSYDNISKKNIRTKAGSQSHGSEDTKYLVGKTYVWFPLVSTMNLINRSNQKMAGDLL